MIIQHKGIEHLSRVIIFLIGIGKIVKADLADGKFSTWEGIALIPKLEPGIAAFKDAGELPGELADLDGPETEQLVQLVEAELGNLVDSATLRDDIDAALGLAPQIANLFNTILNPAPKAPAA